MTDEEYLIHLDFKKNKISSVPYLMRKFKLPYKKALNYIKMLSHISVKDHRNENGEIQRVFLK